MSNIGSSLAFTAYGAAGNPPLVILHGLFGSGRNWSSYAKLLSDTWYVLAVDLPDHGRSPWTSEPLTYPMMAEAVAEFLASQHIDAATVMGHSMGGKVAMTLALTQPERIAALVVVDIAPVPYNNRDREHERYIAAMRAIDTTHTTRRSEVEAALGDDIPDPAIRAFLMQNLVPDDTTGGLRWQCNLAAFAANMTALVDFPVSPTMTPYAGPTRFIVGGNSRYVQEKSEPTLLRLFPNAGIDRLPGAGHWPHAEMPKLFTEKLVRFLASL